MSVDNPAVQRRRAGATLSGLTFTAAAGWMTAYLTMPSQTINETRQSIPWWWFIICCCGVAVGIYVIASTYYPRLLPSKFRVVDLRYKYSLVFKRLGVDPNVLPDSSYSASLYVEFENGGDQLLQILLESFDLKMGDAQSPNELNGVLEFRVLPGQSKIYRFADLGPFPVGSKISGELHYSVLYGAVGGHPSYRRTHSLTFTLTNTGEAGTFDVLDLEPEVDTDAA